MAKRKFHTHRGQELSHRLVPRTQELHKSRRRTWTHRIPEMRGRICICSSKHAGISWFGLVCGACYGWCLAPAPAPAPGLSWCLSAAASVVPAPMRACACACGDRWSGPGTRELGRGVPCGGDEGEGSCVKDVAAFAAQWPRPAPSDQGTKRTVGKRETRLGAETSCRCVRTCIRGEVGDWSD